MDAALLLTLAALALVDSLSVGTLVIPLLLMLAPRVRPGRIVLYLVVIAAFYLAVGIAALAGFEAVADGARALLESTPGRIAQLLVGVALLVGSFFIGSGDKPGTVALAPTPTVVVHAGEGTAHTPHAGGPAARPGRIARWRDRLVDDDAHAGVVVAVALGAGAVELATMLPYLAAMGSLVDSPLPLEGRLLALVAYCAVMVAPAALLLLVRLVAARVVEAPLRRLAAWLEREGPETTAWIVGIVGFLIARGAASELGLFG